MRKILGLGKTDSYWLVHQNYFETILVNGKMRVVIDSFEAWYAMQTKHQKVFGEAPGSKLHSQTYSAAEIAEMLGISKSQANVLVRKEKLPFIQVHRQFQIPKDAFEQWYASQRHYVKKKEKEALLDGSYMTASEMGWRLGIDRRNANNILAMDKGNSELEIITIGDRRYVKTSSFYRWLAGQSDFKEKHQTSTPRTQQRKSKNPAYYTVDEVCRFYGLRPTEVYRKLECGSILGFRVGKLWRINKAEFDKQLGGRRR